ELTKNVFQPDAVGIKDFGAWMELYGLVITGMLTGLKSALKNTLSMSDTLAIERSLTLKSLQTPARAVMYAGQEFLYGLLGVFGVDGARTSRYNSALAEAGAFSAAARLTFKDLRTGGRGRDNNL